MWWRRRREQKRSPEPRERVVELLRTPTVGEAEVVAALLRDHGIHAYAADLRGDMALTRRPSAGRVFIPASDLGLARALVAEAQEEP